MELTLRGETIDIETGQEVTFYRYILNKDKVEFKEDKVVVDEIYEAVGYDGACKDLMVTFKNESHGATLHHYELGDFYLSISNKNVLDFLKRKYASYNKQEKRLQSEIDSLSKQIENLNNDRSNLEILIMQVALRKWKSENQKFIINKKV